MELRDTDRGSKQDGSGLSAPHTLISTLHVGSSSLAPVPIAFLLPQTQAF